MIYQEQQYKGKCTFDNLDLMSSKCGNSLKCFMNRKKLFIPLIIFTVLFASCKFLTDNKNSSQNHSAEIISLSDSQNSSLDSIVFFLLEWSSKDFYENQRPIPVNFRTVHLRKLIGQNSEETYLICGQFLLRNNQGKDEWVSFATIKTDPYEQWIGSNALTYCQDSKEVSYRVIDLSSALKAQMDSLQNVKD